MKELTKTKNNINFKFLTTPYEKRQVVENKNTQKQNQTNKSDINCKRRHMSDKKINDNIAHEKNNINYKRHHTRNDNL